MFKVMTTLHLLAVIFLIGPLVHAVTTAIRGLRTNDAAAATVSARTTTIYAYSSILAVLFGFALMSATSPYTGKTVAGFGETWIWLSTLLWLIGVVIALTVTAPALKHAATSISEGTTLQPVKAKVAGSGGLIGLIFIAIVVLMVYQPGA